MNCFCKMLVLTLLTSSVYSQQLKPISLIPEPKQTEVLKGSFQLSVKTLIVYTGVEAKTAGELFNEFLFSQYGIKLQLSPSKAGASKSGNIFIKVDKEAGAEAYTLSVRDNQIELIGNSAGLFYGIQTLEQLAPLEKSSVLLFQNVNIKDDPRFGYRGLMLDVSRHFYSVSYVKKFLDVMSHYKLNRFHWHLTDDQGWRIEIKKYPKLQSVAAWREPVENVRNSPFIKEGRYGGFYTQKEVKEVVAYASKRHITVIPEIEMPGHSTAALAAYPHLGCTGGPYTVSRFGGITKDVYCAGKDSTFLFLQNVLTEVMALFPGQYIHIGGDETPKDRWNQCPRCQARIKKEGLKNEHELQSYFVQRMEKFVNSKGRKIIGWDEILEGGLAPNATVMSWRGESGGIAAARQKHDVIMSPYTYLYFDYYQSYAKSEPPAFPAYIPLANVYKYEPLSDSLTADQHKYIKGIQANVWGESIRESSHVDYMTYPRAIALSEIAWSPASAKNYGRFLEKLQSRLAALEKEGVMFRIPEPLDFKDKITTENTLEINLQPSVKGAAVYYTLDGSTPTTNSQIFTNPFVINLSNDVPLMVNVLTVLPSGRRSGIYTASYTKKGFKPALNVNPSKKGVSFNLTFDKIAFAKDIKITKADTSGTMPDFSLKPFSAKLALGVCYDGYFRATDDDMYTFKVNSDDGALLFIDDQLIIDNDGEHGAIEKEGSVLLNKGYHKIRFQYFDAGGGRHLEVKASREKGQVSLTESLYN